jgi:hypothetical protein
MSVLQKIRAWLHRRTEGPTDPSKIDHDRQTAMANTGIPYGADVPPNYVPPVDEGRPRH